MNQPAYAASRKPVSNYLRCVARLHLKWLAETLAIIAGIPYVAFAGSPSPRQGASEPRRCLPCRFSPHSLPRRRVGRTLRKLAGSAAPAFMSRPGICQEEEHFEGTMPSLQGTSRVRALGCADVCESGMAPNGLTRCDGITAPSQAPQERTGISSAGCPPPRDVSRARVGVYGSVRTRRRRPAASPAAPTPPCRPGNPKRSDVSRAGRPRSQGLLARARVAVYEMHGFRTVPTGRERSRPHKWAARNRARRVPSVLDTRRMIRQGWQNTLSTERRLSNCSPTGPGNSQRTLHSGCFPHATRENYWHYRRSWFCCSIGLRSTFGAQAHRLRGANAQFGD